MCTPVFEWYGGPDKGNYFAGWCKCLEHGAKCNEVSFDKANRYKLVPRPGTTTTTTTNPALSQLGDRIATLHDALGSYNASEQDAAQDEVLALTQKELAKTNARVEALESKLEAAVDLLTDTKAALDTANRRTEAVSADLEAALQRLDVADFSSTPQDSGVAAGCVAAPGSAPSVTADGGDIEIGACGGA